LKEKTILSIQLCENDLLQNFSNNDDDKLIRIVIIDFQICDELIVAMQMSISLFKIRFEQLDSSN
jgi:hypothetical protein